MHFDYSRIIPDAALGLLTRKLCWHNRRSPKTHKC